MAMNLGSIEWRTAKVAMMLADIPKRQRSGTVRKLEKAFLPTADLVRVKRRGKHVHPIDAVLEGIELIEKTSKRQRADWEDIKTLAKKITGRIPKPDDFADMMLEMIQCSKEALRVLELENV